MNTNLVKNRALKTPFLVLFAVLTMTLSGCSAEYLREGYIPPNSRVVTKIPEINQYNTRSRPTTPKKVVKPYKATVKKYTITSSSSTVISQNEVNAANRDLDVKQQATVNIDPYASIPENSTVTASSVVAPAVESRSNTSKSSPAVTSLMMRARADLAVGKTQSAISKLERGLRIESQNPSIWHLLAKAQYDQANHQQAIAMAKKSIRYSDDGNGGDKLTAQNWTLIKKSGEKSDDAIAIKEALDYFKVNP